MTDERADNLPPDASDGPDSDLVGTDYLDALLADASLLAGSLSEEVGASGPAAGPDAVREGVEAPADRGTDLEGQLTNLEELTRAAGSEIGTAGETPGEPAGQAKSVRLGDGSSSGEEGREGSVPVFMEEFPRPAERSCTEQPGIDGVEVDAASPAPRLPGLISTGPIADLPSYDEIASLHDMPIGGVDASKGPSREPGGPQGSDGGGRRPRAARRVGTSLSRGALLICKQSVEFLEFVDRPLGGIGEVSRRIVGCVALVTFVAALLVLLISLF